MADSNALRQKRKRQHSAGDHSLCAPSRCGGKLATLRNLPVCADDTSFAGPETAGEPGKYGPLTEQVLDIVAGMALDDGDPRLVIGYMVVEMARAWDEHHVPSLAKEIANQMRWLVDHMRGEADAIAEIRARVVRKQADILINFANNQAATHA